MMGPDTAIAVSTMFLGTTVGAGVNQALFTMPKWFASPPESLAPARSRAPAALFIPLQVGALAGLVSALALNRRSRERRKLLSIALALYGVTWLSTAAYFAPEILRLTRKETDLAPSEIAARGKRWLKLTWGRNLALAAAWALAVAALGQRPPRRALGLLRG